MEKRTDARAQSDKSNICWKKGMMIAWMQSACRYYMINTWFKIYFLGDFSAEGIIRKRASIELIAISSGKNIAFDKVK